MRRHFKLAASAAVVLFSVSVAQARSAVQVRNDSPPCEKSEAYKAIDSSIPTHKIYLKNGRAALDVLKDDLGVETIIRYYDWPENDETIACKRLLDDEIKEIFKRKLSIIAVFQHNNDDLKTIINPARGTIDATRALELAEANGQPYGSTIYFGIDGQDAMLESFVWEHHVSNKTHMTARRKEFLINDRKWRPEAVAKYSRLYSEFLDYHSDVFPKREVKSLTRADVLDFIDTYFKAIKAKFDEFSGGDPKKGYKIGAYSSGYVCRHLLDSAEKSNHAVTHCWLAQADGWPEYEDFRDKGNWVMWQKMPTTCPPTWRNPVNRTEAVDFDFNKIRPGMNDIGQWSTQRKVTVPPMPRSPKCEDALSINRPR